MMKTIGMLTGVVCWLLVNLAIAQPGLKGEYYNGTNFEQKVMTRVDPQLSFTWKDHSPGAGVDRSYYSVRWTGKLMAPASGRYTFYAKVDDGIRIWVGNKKVMDVWKLNDSQNYTGSVILQAGLAYDLRVDYFNDMLGGVIELFWERPDEKKPLINFSDTPGTPITAQYFRQTAPPVASTPKPDAASPGASLAVTPKPAPATTPTPAPKPVATLPRPVPKPVATVPHVTPPVVLAKPSAVTTTATEPVNVTPATPLDGLSAGETVVLRQVQFTQSSYVLLPESSVELNKLVQVMTRNPQWHIEVAGHTDNVGDPRLNLALSENRAKVVAHYLVMRGIADDRIEAKGYGSTKPVADNSDEDGRSKNRRVEIRIQ